MNMIAVIILAPVLALFVRNRQVLFVVLAAVWYVLLGPTTHLILLEEQLDIASMANTLSFFAVNLAGLLIGFGIAYLVHRRRFGSRAVDAPAVVG